ncbi:Uncharacterized protein PECH_007503 [Penicillium ucsense]|uniref:Uncharacterized protein n=1 Tax=Penicillium ucsense TaxID=2839758 RepID=A0A8J8W402_9EURO|nr:Uncharacterized protein PECM_004399 [Penicillium ucsense]KAF7738803.1 Uncharacterized protein PECH_007503 [Penicillium ucsense]
MYKTNYELYSSRESLDSRRSPLPEELLSPLAELYPHVAALQPRYPHPNHCTFTGYQDTEYWASAYTTQSERGSLQSSRSQSSCRFVSKLSKLRRFLSRDDLSRRRSKASSAMN